MGVGTAANVPEPCREIQAHSIAPTLPGMESSSSRDYLVPYYVNVANDMNALLNHLYPTGDLDALYLSGGSYGTVPAQMLYGAPYDLFPCGRKIAGLLLLTGFSPLRYHVGYAKKLSWNNWVSIGPPPRIIPFGFLQRLFKAAVGPKLKSVEGATQFLRATVFDQMDDEEKQIFKDWLQKNRFDEHTAIEKMSRSTVRCCKNWDGFMEVSDTIYSDWGLDPRTLDKEQCSKPVLVVASKNEHVGGSSNDWLVASYKSAGKLKLLPGSHISSLFFMDELCRDMFDAPLCVVGRNALCTKHSPGLIFTM